MSWLAIVLFEGLQQLVLLNWKWGFADLLWLKSPAKPKPALYYEMQPPLDCAALQPQIPDARDCG